jgi:hypothetical protein
VTGRVHILARHTTLVNYMPRIEDPPDALIRGVVAETESCRFLQSSL